MSDDRAHRDAHPRDGVGDVADPVVVLIHGLGASHRVFALTSPNLVGTYRMLLVDLIDPGQVDDHARALAGRLDAEGVSDVIAVGHSRGGLVATALAEQRPDLVSRIVLVNTPPSVQTRISAGAATERLLRLPVVGPLLWRIASPGQLRAGLSTAAAPEREVPDVMVEDLKATPYQTSGTATESIDSYLTQAPLIVRLRRLPSNVEVTVIVGTRDQRVDPTMSVHLYERVPHASIVEIPSSGHTPPLETPDDLARALRSLH